MGAAQSGNKCGEKDKKFERAKSVGFIQDVTQLYE